MTRLVTRRFAPGRSLLLMLALLSCSGGSSESSMDAGTVDAGPPALPGAPLNAMGDGGFGQVGVYWAAPASDGNSLITGYTVTASPGGMTGTTQGALYYEFANLTNGMAYTFTVVATNAVGSGPASAASAPVTPMAAPAAPTNVMAVAGDDSATVTWEVNDEGSPIGGCTTTSTPDGISAGSGGAATTVTVMGLTAGTSYTFTVSCGNSIGGGPASAASNAVVPTGNG